jgi:glycosyltransferase involved in cell wall biosynthesis
VPGESANRARLYQTVRSAHLERARQLSPATIYYGGTRYDYDPELAHGLDLVPTGPVRAAWLLARSSVRWVEVNEPLMVSSLRRTALVMAALQVRALLGGPRIRFVSYAIENLNPLDRANDPAGTARRRFESRILARYVWRSLDRVAFGTEAARVTYTSALMEFSDPRRSTVIPAVPSPCDCEQDQADQPGADDALRVLFVGALTERKGFPVVLDAWPYIKERLPNARLTIVGTGKLEERARTMAAHDQTVEVIIAPPRAEVHAQLRRSRVLVLPSHPAPGWREQVGLPICEGLAHGCSVVTSTQTGLAGWLVSHGHRALPWESSPEAVAEALVAALGQDRPAASVLGDLPDIDGRLAADAWLFRES